MEHHDQITAQQLLAGDNWRLTPATMAAKLTGGRFKTPPHIRYISARVASAIYRGNARLIVSMPPRHGKSELLSIHTPPWVFDHWPEKRVMLASYGADLATDFSRKARDFCITHADDLTFEVRKDRQQVAHWMTDIGGEMYAIGVGGAAYGRGADVLLLDDYLKNPDEALSETVRKKIYDWFSTVAMSRLEPGGSAIIIATRWNIDDLIGTLQKKSEEVWEHIELPAIALPDDPLGREIGEALWAERYDIPALELRRKSMTKYYWQAVYQQKPIRLTNMETGEIRVADVTPWRAYLQLVRYWDLAATENAGDYATGTLLGHDTSSGITFILDLKRGQWSPAQLQDMIKATAEQDGHDVPIGIEQEPGSAGKIVIDHYARNVLKGYIVKGFPSTKKKITRAQAFLAAVEHDHVRMIAAPWNKSVTDEVEVFPEGDHDDIVDSLSGGYNFLYRPRFTGIVWGRDTNPQVPGGFSQPQESSLITGVTWGRRRHAG